MQHGFQVRQACGHTVTAAEQTAMQMFWLKNLSKFFLTFVVMFAAIFYLVTRI
jgi:hypothetical protein